MNKHGHTQNQLLVQQIGRQTSSVQKVHKIEQTKPRLSWRRRTISSQPSLDAMSHIH